MPRASSYALTAAAIVASVGAGVFCLDLGALGKTYRLHAERPGPALNRPVRADLPSGAAHVIAPVEPAPSLIRVDIVGAIEQRAGYHDPCGGWSDGHDAIAERLCAAFLEGDVLLVIDSPGGAAAGLQQATERALAAKVQHGRRVTVFADEMIGSAAMWWACALGDEIFVPPAGQTGSIGARGEHVSIAGALAKEGIVKTYFVDPPDKIAWAPEFPLGPVGEARGNRDVKIAADAFRAAVCASPMGVRNGLTPEYLIDLGADMLTGQNAVDAGLADSVENFDAVCAYALALAESEPGSEARTAASTTKITGATRAKEPGMSLRTEEEKKSEEDKGTEPTGKCSHCGMQNEDDAKFCDQCGKSMAAKKMDGGGDDDPPPSSKKPESERKTEEKKEAAHPPPPEKMSTDASLASILGATGDSPLALKTAAISLRQIRDTAVGVTGETAPGKIVGALLTVPEQIERGKRAADSLASDRRAADKRERWGLAHKLNGLGLAGRPRSTIFVDEVGEDGTRRAVKLTPEYARMDLDVFRGLVKSLAGSVPNKPRDPFEPDPARARAASDAALNTTTAATFTDVQRKTLEQHPTILQLQARGSAVPADKLVNGLIATDPKSARNWLAQNGVAS